MWCNLQRSEKKNQKLCCKGILTPTFDVYFPVSVENWCGAWKLGIENEARSLTSTSYQGSSLSQLSPAPLPGSDQ